MEKDRLVILLEEMNGKLDLLLEGQQVLRNEIIRSQGSPGRYRSAPRHLPGSGCREGKKQKKKDVGHRRTQKNTDG